MKKAKKEGKEVVYIISAEVIAEAAGTGVDLVNSVRTGRRTKGDKGKKVKLAEQLLTSSMAHAVQNVKAIVNNKNLTHI